MEEQEHEIGWGWVMLHRPGAVCRHGRRVVMREVGVRGTAVLSTVLRNMF